MEIIDTLIFGYIFPVMIILMIILSLFIFIDNVFVQKDLIEGLMILGVHLIIIVTGYHIYDSFKEDNKIYSEKLDIEHQFTFKTIKEPLKDYPDAKCIVQFTIDEQKQSDHQTTKNDHENEFYLVKDCHEFSQKILDSNINILNELNKNKINNN